MLQKLKLYPTPAAGLALGLASLGVNWHAFLPDIGLYFQLLTFLGAIIILLPLLSKFLFHPRLLLNDLAHPVVGGVVPTFAMAIMVISYTLTHTLNLPHVGIVIWSIGLSLHIIFLGIFLYVRLSAFNLDHMVPSWFVPPIGIIVAAVTVPSSVWCMSIAQVIVIFGMIVYIGLFPIMLYRLILREKIHASAQPTLAILAAPTSLCIAGYLTVFAQPNVLLVFMLLGIALLMTLTLYIKFFYLLRLPFSPGFAAYTFPVAIGASAMFKASHVAMINDVSGAAILFMLAWIELIIATGIIFYVAFKYLRLLK